MPIDTVGDVDNAIERHRCDLVVFVGPSSVDALELCGSPRSGVPCPLLVVYTEATPNEVVMSLDAGADDVMLASVSSAEFLARVAVAIRYREALGVLASSDMLELPGFRIDLVAQTAEWGDTSIHIPGHEFGLLSMLARNLGTVLPTAMLIEQIWPGSGAGAGRLRVCATRLRKRLGGHPNGPVIVAERGVGYAMYLRTAEA